MTRCQILKSNHIGFTVSDLERSAGFFRDLLGFSLSDTVRQHGEAVEKLTGVPGAVLDIQFAHGYGCAIELQYYIAPSGKAHYGLRPCDPGFAHIAFEVDDIDAMAEKVSAAGFMLVSSPQIVPAGPRKGGRNVYVRGPDNIVVEFQSAPPVSLERSLDASTVVTR